MLSLNLEEQIADDVREAALAGLTAFNRPHIGPRQLRPLHVVLRRDDQAIAGALVGETRWDWFYVDLLWIAEDVRGAGWGRRMMQLAEDEARRRGCIGTWLDTLDFQARGFYERLGFSVFGTQVDYPPGHERFFLQKRYR